MTDPHDKPEITLSTVGPVARTSRISVRGWSLEVVGGPDKGMKVQTLEPLLRVGVDPGNELPLTDPTVSRLHLEVERVGGQLVLRDLGSHNGTYLDGRRVIEAWLAPGDQLVVGNSRVVVRQDSEDTEVELEGAESFGELVGASEAMRAVFADLRRLAREDTPLLLEGETGTGKELAARAVHLRSERYRGPFQVVDCTLLTEERLARELFGESAAGEGAFRTAQGGTVFLDEVGELPLALQPKLLRAIEPPDGADAAAPTVRVIAATQLNLEEEVRRGRFRADLYFRLAGARVRLPPLRVRRDELPALARHLLKRRGIDFELSAQTLAVFSRYDWPGNVRELRNVLERGALLEQSGASGWLEALSSPPKKGQPSTGAAPTELPYHEARDRVLADFERIYFAEVMKRSSFDLKVAEKKTGLSMQSLYRLLKKNGLRLKDLKNAEGLS